jgi:uncharacterized protein
MADSELLGNSGSRMLEALRVEYADAKTCTEWLRDIHEHISLASGFRSMSVIRRDGGLGVDFFVLIRFASAKKLKAWKISPKWNAWQAEIKELSIEDVSRQQAAETSIWFEPITNWSSTPKPPVLWKRWLTSMLAVYPALVLLVSVLDPIVNQLPKALGLFVIAGILTGLSTAYIVPFLTRSLHPWLMRR